MKFVKRSMISMLKHLRGDRKAATAIEYGLIAALIAVAAITAMKGLGSQLRSTFNATSSAMSSANPGA